MEETSIAAVLRKSEEGTENYAANITAALLNILEEIYPNR